MYFKRLFCASEVGYTPTRFDEFVFNIEAQFQTISVHGDRKIDDRRYNKASDDLYGADPSVEPTTRCCVGCLLNSPRLSDPLRGAA